MNQMAISFVDTRTHRADPSTSRDAAKHAASGKAEAERIAIRQALDRVKPYGMTAREIAADTGIDYIEVQRRVSESGVSRTTERRDGCAIWRSI